MKTSDKYLTKKEPFIKNKGFCVYHLENFVKFNNDLQNFSQLFNLQTFTLQKRIEPLVGQFFKSSAFKDSSSGFKVLM